MRVKRTQRGFESIQFQDLNGVECSLQQSSIAIYQQPGTSAVWLGCNDANPRVLIAGRGWQDIPLPDGHVANTRMHLNRKQVKALIKRLQNWLDKGSFNDRRKNNML